jgi:hypothetical protein
VTLFEHDRLDAFHARPYEQMRAKNEWPSGALKLPPGQSANPPAKQAARMAKRNRQAVPPQPILTVDETFQLLLKHFGTQSKAIARLKELTLWGFKDGRWFHTDIDQYSLYIHVSQIPNGLYAEVKMQPGRIGMADFDKYRWGFAAKEAKAQCSDTNVRGAKRGPKVKITWDLYRAKFYLFLDEGAVASDGPINIEGYAKKLQDWANEHSLIEEKDVPSVSALRAKIVEWISLWGLLKHQLKNAKPN